MESKVYFFILYPIISVVALLLQAFQIVSIANIYPDLLLVLTVIYAISHGSFKGELYGFAMGLLLDLLSGALFGLNMFVFTIVGACASLFQKIARFPNLIVFILYLFFVTIFKYVLYHICFIIFRGTSLFDFYFFLQIPGELLINLFFGILLYIFCARFDGRENYEWF